MGKIVARGLLDVFLDISHSDEDILAVMEVMVRLSEDAEPTVRTELMEQIPPIIASLQESRLDFSVEVSQYLVPVIVQYLEDPDKQITTFFELCSDNMWGMRKACSECFMLCPTTPPLRSTGPALAFSSSNSLVIPVDSSKTPVHMEPDLIPEGTSAETSHLHGSTSSTDTRGKQPGRLSSTRAEMPAVSPELPGVSGCLSNSCPEAGPGTSEDMFSTFLYWRTPLPDVSKDVERACCAALGRLDLSQHSGEPATSSEHWSASSIAQVQVLSAALRVTQLDSTSEPESKQTEGLNEESFSDPSPVSDNHLLLLASSSQNELSAARILQSTDIIPQPLLDQFASMTDPARAQTVDTDMAKHCAYSLLGVALTLGRQNWYCLKDIYETLACDGQWKVRRTLAFSIHELAVILGDQLTAADVVPVFNGFLKDMDEVGVLKHLYDFLKLLREDKRREHLRQLQEFVVTDSSRDWRFQYELAE
ncbi:serine/threonine-protein phosphatase 4 regulatory subunit 1-like isoform X2 [Onychomys torridus]|uniref:serine/threonine-protein phosphatase 4 regulatory subunit 1-like isoform X2 n=1 Tax=Onychomys torridus TaxID=38674 RepID=UPI00167F3A02|nr:serine/threonine-protein phosphatase 4 regulatory subunit 1-like isoform X2 [Onychomys torridus]